MKVIHILETHKHNDGRILYNIGCDLNGSATNPKFYNYAKTENWDEVTCKRCLRYKPKEK